MKKLIIPAVLMFFGLSLIIGGICTTKIPAKPCPDCGETNCIYQQINNNVSGEGDQDIENAIQKVCKQRGIKDSATIELIRANYYL